MPSMERSCVSWRTRYRCPADKALWTASLLQTARSMAMMMSPCLRRYAKATQDSSALLFPET